MDRRALRHEGSRIRRQGISEDQPRRGRARARRRVGLDPDPGRRDPALPRPRQARLAVEGGDKEQAEADRWSFFITGDLHPAFFPLFVPNRYTRAREKEAFDDIREAAKALAHKKFLLVDAQLTGKRFFLGDKRSYLDAYVFPMERWAQTLLDDGLSAFPAVRAHHDMMAADPAVQRVLAAEGA
jgi:glutathione S-transferase